MPPVCFCRQGTDDVIAPRVYFGRPSIPTARTRTCLGYLVDHVLMVEESRKSGYTGTVSHAQVHIRGRESAERSGPVYVHDGVYIGAISPRLGRDIDIIETGCDYK
jgi:hypothetical protein